MEKTLKDLAVKHSYYCSLSNYYSNDAGSQFATWPDFYAEYSDADIDMNLIFRWDIFKHEKQDAYYMHLFIIHQRKGIFHPVVISRVFEQDVPTILETLEKHAAYLKKLWEPIIL